MSTPTPDLSAHQYAPVMNYPAPRNMQVFDFTNGYDPECIRSFEWGIGRYDEKRKAMYTTEQFGGERNIHMGIDIWTTAGSPVFSLYDGAVAYLANNDQPGDYGPTLVIRYQIDEWLLYALYGHLSKKVLTKLNIGEPTKKGQQIATIGDEEVNGGWAPHLHFQLSWNDPGKADMPGVVAEDNYQQALQTYPDPRLVLGPLY